MLLQQRGVLLLLQLQLHLEGSTAFLVLHVCCSSLLLLLLQLLLQLD